MASVLVAMVALSSMAMAAGSQQSQPKAKAARRVPARASDVYYPNCDAVRAAGAAPIRRGQPGYRPSLDRDDDGIACEPWRGRR
jgi:hypothetical protein